VKFHKLLFFILFLFWFVFCLMLFNINKSREKKMNKQVVFASILTLASVSAVAGTIRHDVDDSLYRALSYNQQFDSVGEVLFTDGTSGYRCSGTVIASNWVLTAGHCVDSAVSMTFQLPQYDAGRTTLLGHTSHTATSWVWHENWTGNNLLAGWDVGLMYFDNPFDVDPAKLYTGSNEAGSVTTHVGYGATGTGLTGVNSPSGTRRAGQNVVDGLHSGEGTGNQLLWSDFDHPDPEATDAWGDVYNDWVNFVYSNDAYFAGSGITSANEALPMEYSIAGGDSGGGAFIQEHGEWFLAGVHSLGANINGTPQQADYGNLFASVRVSDMYDWIQSYTATSVPNPATFGLLGLGLTLLWARRRR
jgi:V8-like Glu-specific endopeptidase